MGAQTKVLQKGKITIPAKIRERLGISEGDYLRLEIVGNKLVLLRGPYKGTCQTRIKKGCSDQSGEETLEDQKMRFVDANVFIYILVKSPREAYETSRQILQRIESGEETITNTAVIQEVVDWLEYNNRKREVKSFITAINSYLTMNKINITWDDMLAALDDMEKHDIDFVDALTLQTMKKNNTKEIYSNDKDFDRIKWIKRIWE